MRVYRHGAIVLQTAHLFSRAASKTKRGQPCGWPPAFTDGRAGALLPDRHFSLPAHVLFAKPETAFAEHAFNAYFALVWILGVARFWTLPTFTILPCALCALM